MFALSGLVTDEIRLVDRYAPMANFIWWVRLRVALLLFVN
jgi:hypothetical protein